MLKSDRVVVCGAGGFLGGHLTAALLRLGHRTIRAVDRKPLNEWFQLFPDVENLQLDLRSHDASRVAVKDSSSVFNFAAEDGGAGFMEGRDGMRLRSVILNAHLLAAAQQGGVQRFFFASCGALSLPGASREVEPQSGPATRRATAIAPDGHGLEKLYSESLCRSYRDDFGMEIRVARYPSVYGPFGPWTGGRERAPAALCRKVAEARLSGQREIEIWGDGRQSRGWLFVDDCIEATLAIMDGDTAEPVLLGGSDVASINQLVDALEEIAGVKLQRRYDSRAPLGVGQGSVEPPAPDKARVPAPKVPLREGLARTYRWIADEMERVRLIPARPTVALVV